MHKENLAYVGRQVLFVLFIGILAVLLFAVGLMVGYGVIGDGDNMWAILSMDKWQELIGKFTGK